MVQVVIADPLEGVGLERLRAAGLEVVELGREERQRLPERLREAEALVVRSATRVTGELLAQAPRLRVVARAGVGVDNVDVEAATARGILVVNAPTANLISAVEHTFALLLALVRHLPAAHASMVRGEWERSRFLGWELQGKALGIVGFGRIGQRVAQRARAFEMRLLAFDPYLPPERIASLGAEPVRLEDLLERSDVVTLHTPLTRETRHLIGPDELARMKPGAFLVNCGRGGLVDEQALLEALERGHLAGAGLDVFEVEPTPKLDLVRHPRVVATPHLGAQTREAQERVAIETAEALLAALAGDFPLAAVNLPFAPVGHEAFPYLVLAGRLGQVVSELLGNPLGRLEVELVGVPEAVSRPAVLAALHGALLTALGPGSSLINVERLAAERSIELVRVERPLVGGQPASVRVRAVASGEGSASCEVVGMLAAQGEPRVVELQGYRLEFWPEGYLLVLENRDVPGVVGRIGSALGEAGINISDIHLARDRKGSRALAVLRLDEPVPESIVTHLGQLEGILSVRAIAVGSDSVGHGASA